MTKKRFTIVVTGSDGSFHYWDKFTDERITSVLELENKLNEQHEQIERLKRNFRVLEEVKCELAEENEQLKQFQDRVFSWIDMHLQRLPTLIDDEFESDNEFADPSLYSGALQILETMKKELKGDVE